MLDTRIRSAVEIALLYPARALHRLGVSANVITAVGAIIGLLAFCMICLGFYQLAIVCICLNRLADGLDGAVARLAGATDLGGYLDIVFDFMFYASIPLGFAFADPAYAQIAAFLIFCFIGTGSSFLAFAIIVAKHDLQMESQQKKSFYYLGGLTEGAETIGFLILICVFPSWFFWLSLGFGCLCLITTATRIFMAVDTFSSRQ
ncbi:MAG: CDP-alcohol phosphatidyltransferase [Candidatus Puniceispirillum sp. TMED52]|nr:CDP-alcohol phosphatidyltransferase [SAR116 cluster bacterium]OUU54453.1 MAG: CDP-alcohol phosphatidyltransferase [Candidatus Puniceispirillum sp. TMED52]